MARKRQKKMESEQQVTPADTNQEQMPGEVPTPSPKTEEEASAEVSQPLSPSSVETVADPAASIQENDRVVPRGHVLLVALDAGGNEIPDSSFIITESGYKRMYSDETKFRLKKKAQ